jgi:c-di-GMP-binding flagellar brake protein YcgR
MLWRLFSKAKATPDRTHYRSAPSRSDGIGVQIASVDGLPVSGRLIDMSAGGAAIEFDQGVEQDLVLGAVRTITFSSLNSSPLRVESVVRSLPTSDEPNRYGFQFVDEVELDREQHAGFLRLFNRRRDRRARPGLDERLGGKITLHGVSHEVTLHDVSMGGASVRVPSDLGLEVGSEFELRFSIPRSGYEIVCLAEVKSLCSDALGTRAGVATALVPESDTKRNLDRAQAALADYIERRVTDMERYNSAFE